MKKAFQIIIVILSVLLASSCTQIEEDNYDIVGNWKFSGFNGKDYPEEYHFLQVTNDMIIVYDRRENQVDSFGYKRTNNNLTLTAPFAGEYTSVLVESASYNEAEKLGQMCWDCGNGQKYFFCIWER